MRGYAHTMTLQSQVAAWTALIALLTGAVGVITAGLPPLRPAAVFTAAPPPPDFIVPVAQVDVADLADTWGAARSGGRKHLGIDIMAPKGRPVRAAAHGEIVRLATTTLGGTAVYQRDATGDLILYYAHLDRYAPGLKEGALVDQGEVIGYVGATGNATVPHLHFEITRQPDAKRWSGGKPVNPYPVLKTGALAPPAQAANSGSTPGGR